MPKSSSGITTVPAPTTWPTTLPTGYRIETGGVQTGPQFQAGKAAALRFEPADPAGFVAVSIAIFVELPLTRQNAGKDGVASGQGVLEYSSGWSVMSGTSW
jgi:hypothetical protein